MTIAEQISAIVKTLPQEQASEILNFAEYIRSQYLHIHQPITVDTSIPWQEMINSLAGAWGEDFPMVEEISTQVGEDIFRESL